MCDVSKDTQCQCVVLLINHSRSCFLGISDCCACGSSSGCFKSSQTLEPYQTMTSCTGIRIAGNGSHTAVSDSMSSENSSVLLCKLVSSALARSMTINLQVLTDSISACYVCEGASETIQLSYQSRPGPTWQILSYHIWCCVTCARHWR